MRKTEGRILACASLALAVASAPSPAAARSLADILADKGILTGEEKDEALDAGRGPYLSYRPGRGLVLATPDDRFSLGFTARLQLRYTLTDVDHFYEDPSAGVEDSQSFDVPRARLTWEGHAFTRRLRYKMQVELADGGNVLRDAELEYHLVPDAWLRVKGGQLKTPFCRQEMTSSGKLEFVDRSLACQNLRFDRDRGVMLYGRPHDALVEYYAGVFNGTGRNGPANSDANFLYVARLVTNPLGEVPYSEGDFEDTPEPLFAVGVSYGYERARASEFTTAAQAGPDPDDPTMEVITSRGSRTSDVPFLRTIQPFYRNLANPDDLTAEIHNLETDLAFRWRGFDLQFEYFLGLVHNAAHAGAAPAPPFSLPSRSFQARGYYVQGGYFLIAKKLQIAIRYSELAPNDELRVTTSRGRTVTPHQTELLGALSYYFHEHDLKIQTDFGPVDSIGVPNAAGDIGDRNDFRWRIQAQLIF